MDTVAILLLMVSVPTAFTQAPWAGTCPEIPAVRPLNRNAYMGWWFEAERYFFFPEITGKCISLNYTSLPDGSLDVQVRFTETVTSTQMVLPGNAIFLDPAPVPAQLSGNLQLTLTLLNPVIPTVGVLKTYTFRVVATDYQTYAIHWSCYSLVGVHFTALWVVVRDRTYPASVRNTVRQRLRSLGLDAQLLQRTDQNGCDRVPVPISLG